jgi:hypothetical protein
MRNPAYMMCPQCYHNGRTSDKTRDCIIVRSINTLRISYELDLNELPCLEWLAKKTESNDLYGAIFESIVFDLDRGRTYIELTTDSRSTTSFEIICDNILGTSDPLLRLIKSSKKVQKQLKVNFEKLWGTDLPFRESKLSIDKYILLTCFVGYKRPFYNAIPFSLDSEKPNKLDRSFQTAAAQIFQYVKSLQRFCIAADKVCKKTVF